MVHAPIAGWENWKWLKKESYVFNKAPTHDDTQHHITHIGIGSDTGYAEHLPVEPPER